MTRCRTLFIVNVAKRGLFITLTSRLCEITAARIIYYTLCSQESKRLNAETVPEQYDTRMKTFLALKSCLGNPL